MDNTHPAALSAQRSAAVAAASSPAALTDNNKHFAPIAANEENKTAGGDTTLPAGPHTSVTPGNFLPERDHPAAIRRKKKWIPLESNPQLLTKYAHKLGMAATHQFNEILSPDLLFMVPQPASAVLALFPISKESERHKQEEALRIQQQGQALHPNITFVKQVIGNACGTIGIIHAMLNANPPVQFTKGSFFDTFQRTAANMSPDERAIALEDSQELEDEHKGNATEAKSDATHAVNDNLHFNCFVRGQDNCLYELDGRKHAAINHGKIEGDLLTAAVNVLKGFMERAKGDIRFNMVALGPPPTE